MQPTTVHLTGARQKIRKPPPFALGKLTPEYPPIAHLLAHTIGQLENLPDFSDNSQIAVFSDFGGEHKGARLQHLFFSTHGVRQNCTVRGKVRDLRQRHGLLTPFSEFAFKDLAYGPRSRALPEFLEVVDHFIHGVVVTVAVEKQIGTVFGKHRSDVHRMIEEQLAAMDLGRWKGVTAEKLLRACCTVCGRLRRSGRRIGDLPSRWTKLRRALVAGAWAKRARSTLYAHAYTARC